MGAPNGIKTLDKIEDDTSKPLMNPEEFTDSIPFFIERSVKVQTSLYNDLQSKEDWKFSKIREFFKRGNCCNKTFLKNFFLGLFPIISWLPKYEKKNLPFDLIAGFTVAVFNIPQGMAYSLLANLPPIIGIYMAFFPIIIYSIMGTSRHLAVGTFAIISLMSGQVIVQQVAIYEADLKERGLFNATSEDGEIHAELEHFAIEVGTALSFSVGIWQVLLGFFKLGSISVLLFPELVSGFTTGAALHVITSQIKDLFGLKIPRQGGFFNIIMTYIHIFKNIGRSNIASIIISLMTMVFLIFYNEFLKQRIAKKIPFPLPIELIIIIIATLTSRYCNFSENFNLSIIGEIPKGLPHPELPMISIVRNVIVNGLLIAIVAYAISVSVAKIFSQKHKYKINPNQELIAHGSSNIIGSLFNCFPSSASLTRCVINESVGAKTQMAGLFCASILLVVLLWIAPFFETVPNCVLSAMIVVALKGMFLQVYDLAKAWRESKINGGIWLLTFLSTIILDIEYGLLVGLILSILSLVWRSNRPYIQILGAFEDSTGLYVDIKKGKDVVKEIPGIKIIKYIGGLNFATIEFFLKRIKAIVPMDEYVLKFQVENKGRVRKTSKIHVRNEGSETGPDPQICNNKLEGKRRKTSIVIVHAREIIQEIEIDELINWIILDLSTVSSIDPVSSKGIQNLVKEYAKIEKRVLFGGISTPVLETLIACGIVKELGKNSFFPTIHDACLYAQSQENQHKQILNNNGKAI